jgi:Zn-dependent protease with chaperone function
MSVAIGLLGYAALLAFAVPGRLRRAHWAVRAPRLAMAVWRALSISALISVVLAGLALATGWLLGEQAATFGYTFAPSLRPAYGGGWAPGLAAAGAVISSAVTLRVAWCLASERVGARRRHRRHLAGLALLARPEPALGAVLVDAHTPATYCLPGRRGGIVVTSTAVQLLDSDQLGAVLEHERAHLRGRHHQRLVTARGLVRAFPWVPLFGHAHDALAVLVEMAADDVAAGQHTRGTLAQALIRFGLAGAPSPALAAGGDTAIQRIERMLAPPRPLRLPARTAGRLAAVGMVGVPAATACVPLAVLACLTAGL